MSFYSEHFGMLKPSTSSSGRCPWSPSTVVNPPHIEPYVFRVTSCLCLTQESWAVEERENGDGHPRPYSLPPAKCGGWIRTQSNVLRASLPGIVWGH